MTDTATDEWRDDEREDFMKTLYDLTEKDLLKEIVWKLNQLLSYQVVVQQSDSKNILSAIRDINYTLKK